MKKITELKARYGEYIQLIFKALFLTHLLLCYNFKLVGTGLSKAVMLITVFSGFVLLLTRLIDIKEIIHSFEGIIILAFAVSFVISVAVNQGYGLKEGVKYFIWLALLLGGVFWVKRGLKSKAVAREALVLSVILVAIVTLFNIESVWLLITKSSSIYAAVDGNHYVMGFAPWGRLYGIYVDPNYGAAISCLAVIASIFCISRMRKTVFKVLFALSILPNLLYCSFSASRTGKLCLVVGMFMLTLIYLWKKCNKLFALKTVRAALLSGVISVSAALLAGVISFTVLSGIQASYNVIQNHIAQNHQNELQNEESKQVKDEVYKIGRKDEELKGDISNRRFDIWTTGFSIFKNNPIVGIGWKNTIPYVSANMPDSYLLGDVNGLADFDVFHNSFIDVFVFQGAVGGIIMLVFIVYILILIFKKIKRRDYDGKTFALSLSGLMLCTLSGCVLSVLVYYNNALSYFFWLFLGYIVYYCKYEETL